ncbi:MAG: SURF1 family protein [Sphingomonadales bacterium]
MFRPALLLPVLAFALLIGLGSWQVQRLGEKRELLALMAQRLAQPPVSLPAVIDGDDAAQWRYRPARATGRFLHDRERYVYAIGPDQARPGYHVYTPLQRAEGPLLLVNRGWVPASLRDPATRMAGQIEGMVTVAGLARLDRQPNAFTPPDEPARHVYYAPRVDVLAAGLDAPVLPVMLEADPTPNPGGWPQGGVTRVDIPNNHLQYALTWYGLAAVMAIIVLLMWRRTQAVARPPRDQ